MKKYINIAFVLFILHTAEEATFQFWQSDASTLWASALTGLAPASVYWIGQFVAYLFLLLLLATRIGEQKWAQVLLGVVLVLEFQHLFVALQPQHYEPGLVSGAVLGIFSLFYWRALYVLRGRPKSPIY